MKRNRKLPCFLGWMRGFVFFPGLLAPTLVMGQANAWCSPPYLVEWPATNPVWSFCWKPPSQSSGIKGSGIEISHAFYKGQRVFWNAHIPIQRVKYEGDVCGPYRDWHNEEYPFQCDGTIVGKACFGTAKTICDGLPDGNGNFKGVVIDDHPTEVVLISVMKAGWYRYVQEWHFGQEGTLTPRFFLYGAAHACTNYTHTHHVYWRYDFDLNGSASDVVQESPQTSENWTTLEVETSRIKNPPSSPLQWRTLDTPTLLSGTLVPGPSDGVADAFSKADLWALRYHDGQIGDSATAYSDKLSSYINSESINSKDVVVWYVGHGYHQGGQGGCHVVGPDIKIKISQ